MALNFNHFAINGNARLKGYAQQLDLNNNIPKAGRILNSILHALRGLIPVWKPIRLNSQLPMFFKAVYVNGWSRYKMKKIKTKREFINPVRKYDGLTSMNDFGSDVLSKNYIDTTFILLQKYISFGEMKDIKSLLTKELKPNTYNNIIF